MANGNFLVRTKVLVFPLFLAIVTATAVWTEAEETGPEMLYPHLGVRTVIEGLTTPSSLSFVSPYEFFVLEKNTGVVWHVVLTESGPVQHPVLDLAVNFGSERGLLGIAPHSNFPTNPGVYLYWTESTTGSDTNVLSETPLLGNRVDRFVWNGSALTFDRNLIQLRALQPPNPPIEEREFGNHDGGVITFGPDGKLYIIIGDTGRRGGLQNLPLGPFGDGSPDDQFGGPLPDDAHLTGVILRLNDDGSIPVDNPYYSFGASLGGEIGENLQKIFAYGIRNSFGMAFDPYSGHLWIQVNGDDSFDELNRIVPGENNGWIQVMGPLSRVAQFKEIETTFGSQALQQTRWPPTNIADTPEEAGSRLVMLPGATYHDPEFSWKYAVAPAAIGFINGKGLGALFKGDLLVGASTPNLKGGYLFRFSLSGNREKLLVIDPRLRDRVADNTDKHDLTESETLLFGKNFGVVTDIETGPNGNVFAVSLSNGAVYEIFRRHRGPFGHD